MDKQETAKLIMFIRSLKPSAFAWLDDSHKEMTIVAWYRKLHEFSLDKCIEAVESYYENPENRKGTNPPMPDDIKDQIMMDNNPDLAINLDDSFSTVNKKILQISPTPLWTHEKGEIAPEDRLREVMSDLEWEAVSMLGGHRRFRDATLSELPFLRKDYKDTLESLINQAKQGKFVAKYDDPPSLEEMDRMAIEAQEKGIDTTKFRTLIQGMIKPSENR